MSIETIDVLVVDDAIDAAESLALMLERDGYRAQFAMSGHEALALLERFQPLCVILDFQMPGMDGLELARSIKHRFGEDVVLVAVTGLADQTPRMTETFAVVDHYFTKPIPLAELAKIFPPKPPLTGG